MIKVSDAEYINYDHVVKVSKDKGNLRILFSTGESEIIYDESQVNFVMKQIQELHHKTIHKNG
jgi:hypothetical protein